MVYHSYHMVENSPWPIISSFGAFTFMVSIVCMLHLNNFFFFFFSFFLLILNFYLWWRDVIRESLMEGMHTFIVKQGLKMGMILFIISEIFFFISLFWAYFHSMLSPSIEIGMMWPPKGIIFFNPYEIPLLNTMVLLMSGFTITWSHYSILNNKKLMALVSLLLTVSLGIYFSLLQYMEYKQALFTINDGICGSVFYMLTGFHGLHVIYWNYLFKIKSIINNNKLNSHKKSFKFSNSYLMLTFCWCCLVIFMYFCMLMSLLKIY
uniref:Cytochrome c oxidase subunit 3 n=3 Tax=Varroa destructor TaxID=109461 RepID=Q8HEI3_VARDE|nr:cytochrome oxidase subunit III [Varroa destructor]